MSEGLYGRSVDSVKLFHPLEGSESEKDDVSSLILSSSHFSAEEQKLFDELLSGKLPESPLKPDSDSGGKSNDQIFGLGPVSVEDQKKFQKLLSEKPAEICPRKLD